ncbi:MAG: hypothetical protein R2861_10705 [Desulfobacterales bacterium]
MAFDMAQRYNADIRIFHVLGIPTRGYSQWWWMCHRRRSDPGRQLRDLVKEEIGPIMNARSKNQKMVH